MTSKTAQTLILYSTVDGHTESICQRISKKLTSTSNVKVVSIEDVDTVDLGLFNKIIIGASVRYGNHRANLYQFIEKNLSILETTTNAFFSVNLTARKSNKNTPETNPYLKKFLKKTSWKPDFLGVFAGKLNYPEYDCVNKLAIVFIMLITGGPTDINQVYEFTDWEKVDDFAKQVS